MENSSRGTGRRTLLQRALALLAGGAAVAAGAKLARGERAAADDGSLVVYARTRPFAGPPSGGSAAPGGPVLASGDLLDAPDGKAIGSFHTNCFCHGAVGRHQLAKPSLEFQVLQLKDGTLYGICAGDAPDGAKSHAIVGGTGRFAGARGQYLERLMAGQPSGHDVVQFVLTLAV